MAIYSGFTHWKWWFSIVMLVYQRVMVIYRDSQRVWLFFCLSLEKYGAKQNPTTNRCSMGLPYEHHPPWHPNSQSLRNRHQDLWFWAKDPLVQAGGFPKSTCRRRSRDGQKLLVGLQAKSPSLPMKTLDFIGFFGWFTCIHQLDKFL